MVQLQGEARREYVARMFTRIAGRYDLMNSVMTLGMHHRWRREVAELASRGLEEPALSRSPERSEGSPKGLALDVAAGTGDLTLALSTHENITRAVGLDLLPVMLHLAGEKAFKRNAGRVHFVAGDALRLPFRDNTFACATCAFGLRNMPGVRDALAEMARVLRPGGALVTLEIVPLDPGRWTTPFLRFYFRQVIPRLGGLITGDREAYTYLRESADRFPTPYHLVEIMEDVGLDSVTYRYVGLRMMAIHRGVKLV
ncbi:MAG: ubiquinone/menaquinone biosynthesis methyltransferase [Dehalococcoidia bacterium]|nr:ubiquinone/menaquinone biosynthesis methyltransferase [Dehalococcoidia bacterium]